jgi:hypothetical protein
MKKKILSLLAAFFMLFGTSAMAQVDSTLEGDVNGDGVVDIADITAVIAIIKQNAEANPTYYWYLGWDNEDWYTNTNLVTSTNGWNETSTNAMPTTYNKTNGQAYSLKGTQEDTYLVLIMPENWPVPTIYTSGKDAKYDISVIDAKSITINGVRYKLYSSAGTTSDPKCYIND